MALIPEPPLAIEHVHSSSGWFLSPLLRFRVIEARPRTFGLTDT
jgi:hypothetical protein